MKVIERTKGYGTCIHIYDAERDGPYCGVNIKRSKWEVKEMPYDDWLSLDWKCWHCVMYGREGRT